MGQIGPCLLSYSNHDITRCVHSFSHQFIYELIVFISLFDKTNKHVDDDTGFHPFQGVYVVCCITDLLMKTLEGAKTTFEISNCMFRLDKDLFENAQMSSRENEKLTWTHLG